MLTPWAAPSGAAPTFGVMDRLFGTLGGLAGTAVTTAREAVDGLRRQAGGVCAAVPDRDHVQTRDAVIVESGIDSLAVYTVRCVIFLLLALAVLWVFQRRMGK